MDEIATLSEPAHAELLMHPLRRRIMEEAARAPVSATEVARVVDETRQKVNYHVRALVEAGLLEAAGERPRRGLTEKMYRASARSYAVSPEVLGRLQPAAGRFQDAFSAGRLLALAARTHAEVARSAEQAQAAGKRLATLSVDADVRFETAAQQAAFAEALTQAVTDVVARFTTPDTSGRGHRYRIVAGAYPRPHDTPDEPTPEDP